MCQIKEPHVQKLGKIAKGFKGKRKMAKNMKKASRRAIVKSRDQKVNSDHMLSNYDLVLNEEKFLDDSWLYICHSCGEHVILCRCSGWDYYWWDD